MIYQMAVTSRLVNKVEEIRIESSSSRRQGGTRPTDLPVSKTNGSALNPKNGKVINPEVNTCIIYVKSNTKQIHITKHR